MRPCIGSSETHTTYKMAVYAFPKGNPEGWGRHLGMQHRV